MKLTVRQKIFAHMGLLIVIIGISHAVTNQIYMNIVFDQFRMQEIDAGYLSATPSEQIEILKTYVIDRMKWIGPGKGVFILLIGLFFSLWISGVLTVPLRKLMSAIERVAHGDLDVNVPVQTKDEYGKVIETFNDMTLRLRAAEDARRRLIADVAHELRTPLSIIQLKLENAHQTGQSVSPETLLRLHDEVIRLSLLVEDLHVLSLAEAGRLSLDRKPLDLTKKLEQIVDDVKMEAEENGLDIRLSSKVGAVIVPVDARRITQVFINLLTNSIRYTPTGGSISVVIDKETTNRNEIYASVSIMDNGMGIPEEEIPQLFDRFYRVEKARSRHSGGAGLGLSIAHQFVRAHDGFIRVESQLNKGSTFTVYLPI